MTVATLKPLLPKDAIAALAARGQLSPTFAWQDMWEADHAAAFTVAKSAGFDVLSNIYASLQSALADGTTFRDFAKDLTPSLQAKGWWGKQPVTDPQTGEVVEAQLGSTRRLQTIFDVNMRVSYASGHWAQFERNKDARPYLRYVSLLVGEYRRPEHIKRHNLCLPVDDPYWDKWAPPCGWGCKCTLQALSQRDVDRMRGQLKFTPPDDSIRSYVNARTGEITRVPNGIDPGWGYNPGKAGWRASNVAQKLVTAPPELAAAEAADPSWPASRLADEFAAWFDLAAAGKPVDRSMMVVGSLNRATLDALKIRGVEPDTAAITVQQTQVRHMLRDAKTASARAVPTDMLRRLPVTLAQARAVLRDKRDGDLLYVFDVPDETRLGKLVVRINFSARARASSGARVQVQTNDVRTAGLVDPITLADPATYEVLSGSL